MQKDIYLYFHKETIATTVDVLLLAVNYSYYVLTYIVIFLK